MRSLNASYAVVFYPDDAQKFYWIARFAGLKADDYLSFPYGTPMPGVTYEPTERGLQLTLLRLLFDAQARPEHFEKLYDDGQVKIFRILYPANT